jgi:hypothetical protein
MWVDALPSVERRSQIMTEHIKGADILLDAYDLVIGDRQKAYSHPSDDYAKVATIFESLTGVKLTIEQALLFMVSVKFARLRTNLEAGRLHRDSVVDAAGYLACLSMHDANHQSAHNTGTNVLD